MLQTELNAENISDMNMMAKTDKQAEIVKKLEELNQWQEGQKKLLQAKQIMQRQVLGMEQQTMYQMLGLESDISIGIQNTDGVEIFDTQETDRLDELSMEESTEESLGASQIGEEEEVDQEECKDANPASYRTITSGYETEVCKELEQVKTKRPFLKRGEGLKQRFKIDPDEFRLNNLPKYKYANAHPRLRPKPLNTANKIKDFKIKRMNTVKLSSKNIEGTPSILDIQEQRFQNLLIASKNNCSSTPDTKSLSKIASTNSKNSLPVSENISFKEIPVLKPSTSHEFSAKDASKSPSTDTHIIAWSKILDPLEIEPLQVPRNCKQNLPETEQSIFELLEQKANDGSFDMNSTCLKEFMTRRITEKLNDTDDNIPVNEHLKSKRLKPVILGKRSQESTNSSADEVDEEETQLPDDAESTKSDDTTHKTIENTNSTYQQNPQIRVRFSDSNETHEYDEDPEATLNETSHLSVCSIEQEGQGDTSKNELFTQFKQALFAALQVKADQHLANDTSVNGASDTTLTPNSISNNSIFSPACKELQEKTEMIKIRLAELEKEIQVFKENNVVLMKAKQEHELQKTRNAQEHLEAMDSLKDERIRMEIYLHDERVKLEDEKRQCEQNIKMKTQGLIAKERRECTRLKDQVIQLEAQLKSKDNNHTAAQTRLRTQIRNMEREQSKLHEQIENLTRENKRLENENLRISREQNNKILLEINRNIAKLAPKQIQHSTNTIPDEGPPTLGTSRTVSKNIVAAATANKFSGKPVKSTSSKVSNVKSVNNRKTATTGYKDTSPETSFIEEMQQHNHIANCDQEDEDDDLMREFHMPPEKGNNIPKVPHVNVHMSPDIPLPKIQNKVPAPPPSSPRSSGGCNNNMKREIVNADGSKDIWYSNGNLKKISADGMIIRMLYYNKDIKETNINEGTVKYYYADSNTWHTTYLDGLEILEFPNGQVEHRHKNGVVEVHYPNNSVKIMDANDEHKQEEWRFPDGTHLVQLRNGDKILSLPNGQKEIHNKLHKRREYPDGTVKIVYPDGSTETRYSNGRVRLKDKDGKLVMDTDMAK